SFALVFPRSIGVCPVLGQMNEIGLISCVRSSIHNPAVTSLAAGRTLEFFASNGLASGPVSACGFAMPSYGVPHVGVSLSGFQIVRGYEPLLSFEYSSIACPIIRRLLAHC